MEGVRKMPNRVEHYLIGPYYKCSYFLVYANCIFEYILNVL